MNNYQQLFRPWQRGPSEEEKAFVQDLYRALDAIGIRSGEQFVIADRSLIVSQARSNGDLEGPGQARKTDPPTAKSAAEQLGRAGNKRRAVLGAIVRAGERGLTSEEAVEMTGIEYRTLTPRIGELKRGGFIVALDDVTRPGTHGAQQQVLVATRKGALGVDDG